MTISVFDLFSIGIGPSSSHTVGPMRAAVRFLAELGELGSVEETTDVRVDLYGSLAATGAGHGTMSAILLGLEGFEPETIDTEEMEKRLEEIRESKHVRLAGGREIPLSEEAMVLRPLTVLAFHPNGMTLAASDSTGATLHERTYFSIGGGFVVTEDESNQPLISSNPDALSFGSGAELLELTRNRDKTISEIMLEHECGSRTAEEVRERLLHIRDVMIECEKRGISRDGLLPGSLRVRRRAHDWYMRLEAEDPQRDPQYAEDWVNLVALAVNEENAAGGKIVTAPTNGAAGIIPAVLHYAMRYTAAGRIDPDDVSFRFLLAAGAIGSLYKERASISGAEVGCQGEVGSAASMAAAGLAEILGGSPAQVENAAEIAMEHSLGLTCDPIGGLVQIPCIERNAIRAALIDKYKETSTGGLAVNVPVSFIEC